MDNNDEKNTKREIDLAEIMMFYAGPAQMSAAYVGPTQIGMVYAGPPMMAVYAGPVNSPAPDNMMGIGTVNIREGIYCFCPECGTMSKGENFCRDCGTPLKDAKRYRDCPGCGTRLGAEEKFCRECGKKQDTEETGLA